MDTGRNNAVTLFYCYAREDLDLLEHLKKHLAPLKRLGYLNDWDDRQIEAGTDWRFAIESHLSDANVILLLLSPDFVYSDVCNEEMRRAMAFHREARARVIPILLRPVLWENTLVAQLAGLPDNGEPITTWPNRDQAFRQVSYHLTQIIRQQLDLPPLPIQEWQALISSPPQEPLAPSQPLPVPAPFVPRNPYPGLRAFTPENAGDFFGRDRLISDLLQVIQKGGFSSSHTGGVRLLSVVGPSGSGKSSVVMAGLLPALKEGKVPGSEHWIYLEPMVPGKYPLEALAQTLSYQFPQRSLLSLQEDLEAPNGRGFHLLLEALLKGKVTTIFLYIDQFEELFLQTFKDKQTQFLHLLLTALTESNGTFALILSFRADFYDRPMLQAPQFFALMQAGQISVLPLDQRDLRDIY